MFNKRQIHYETSNQSMESLCVYMVIMLASLNSCASPSFKQTNEGVIVQVSTVDSAELQHIRLKVINDNIVHVSATPGKHFSTEESLITTSDLQLSQSYNVTENETEVILTTKSLAVRINKQSGEIILRIKMAMYCSKRKQEVANPLHQLKLMVPRGIPYTKCLSRLMTKLLWTGAAPIG